MSDRRSENCITLKTGAFLLFVLLAMGVAQAQAQSLETRLGGWAYSGVSIARADRFWLQAQVGGSLLDAREDSPASRASFGLQAGRRFGRVGVFGNIEFDQSLESKKEAHPSFTQLGLGLEYLNPSGFLRSSFSGGVSVLNSEMALYQRGDRGWYVDLRPISVRWGKGRKNAVEFTPLSIDITTPVASNPSQILFGYFTTIAFEWAS